MSFKWLIGNRHTRIAQLTVYLMSELSSPIFELRRISDNSQRDIIENYDSI